RPRDHRPRGRLCSGPLADTLTTSCCVRPPAPSGGPPISFARMSPRVPRRRTAPCWTSGPHPAYRSPLRGLLPHRSASRSSVLLSVSSFGPSALRPTMASADFWRCLRGPLDPRSTAAHRQISPGIAHPLSRLCVSDLRRTVPCKYRALTIWAASPQCVASIRFLFVTPAFCLRLPSDPQSPG